MSTSSRPEPVLNTIARSEESPLLGCPIWSNGEYQQRNVSIKAINGVTAPQAAEAQHEMTFFEALKLYPGAVGWSMFFSLGIIMTAFDGQLLGNLYATPAFRKDFGYLFNGSYIISAGWQTALGMGNPIGQVFGALAAGHPMEWYGRKKACSSYMAYVMYELTYLDIHGMCYQHRRLRFHPILRPLLASTSCWRATRWPHSWDIRDYRSCICI